jgi:hypothetical protein
MPRVALFLLLAVTCTACLRSTTVVSIRPDGTGTIVQETGMSAQALAMMQSMAAGGAEQKQGVPPEIFGEEQAKKAAATMGVTFLSGEAIKTADMEGYRARFSFDDVRKLQMKMNQDPTAGLATGKDASDPPFGFGFERRGESAILTITMPDETPAGIPGLGAGMGGSAGTSPEQNAQAVQMMKMMMQGLFVDISIDIDGRIVKTNAPYVDGSRLTLLQLDFDKLMADESGLQKLQGATDLKSLGNVAGLRIITERKVTVEFSK